MKIPCPACGQVVDLDEHFKAEPSCEEEAVRQFRAKVAAGDEKLRQEDPERYALLQKLRGLQPTAGSDPDFNYPEKA